MTDSATARLMLPLLEPGQAQKEMFHNEALARIDVAIQARVVAAGVNVPPPDPAPGECWIAGESPEGAWAGRAHAIAGWTAAGWRLIDAFEGMRCWVSAAEGFATFTGGEWHVGECYGRLIVDGEQLVGSRGAAIADPAGGTSPDAEARDAIAAILAALRTHGLIDPG